MKKYLMIIILFCLLKNAYSQCSVIYGLQKNGPWYLKAYNYSTNTVKVINTIPRLTGLNFSVYVPGKDQYIVKSDLNYYIIDALKGIITDSLRMPVDTIEMLASEYDSRTDRIFGVYKKFSTEYFASINVGTKSKKTINSLPGVNSISSSSAFNSRAGQYIVNTNIGTLVIDTSTGNVVDTLAVPYNLLYMKFDSAANKIYGVHYDTTEKKEYFAYYDFIGKQFNNVNILTGITGVAGATYNKLNQKYILKSNAGIIEINVNNASYQVLMVSMDEMSQMEFAVPVLPVPVISATADTLKCSVKGIHYAWMRNAVILPNDSIAMITSQSGNYTVAVQLSNGCLTVSSDPVVVKPPAGNVPGCALIYGLERNGPWYLKSFRYFDSATKVINTLPQISGNISSSTYIPSRNQYIVLSGLYYYVIDAVNGLITDSLSMPVDTIPMIAVEYDMNTNQLFGTYKKQSALYLGAIHLGTKTKRTIGTISNGKNIRFASAFNSRTGNYILGTDSGMYVIDTTTGNILSALSVPYNFEYIEFDSAANRIYGVHYDTSAHKEFLGYFDFAGSHFYNVNALTGITTASGATYNKYTQKYILSSNYGLLDIDVSNGSYAVLVTTLNAMIQPEFAIPVLPVPVINVSGDTLKCSVPGSHYIWFRDSSILSNDTRYILPLASGHYTVMVETFNGCLTVPSDSVAFIHASGVTDISQKGDPYIIFPNPTSGNILNILVPQSVNESRLSIFDISGKKLYDARLDGNGRKTLSLPSLESGIYLINITTADRSSFNCKYLVR